MDRFIRGFGDELIKSGAFEAVVDPGAALRQAERKATAEAPSVLKKIRGEGQPVKRDYLSSMLIGGVAAPIVAMAAGRLSRGLHNKLVRAEMRAAPASARAGLESQLRSTKMYGRIKPGMSWNQFPILTPEDTANRAATGALMGSVVQALRDHFSGSAPK